MPIFTSPEAPMHGMSNAQLLQELVLHRFLYCEHCVNVGRIDVLLSVSCAPIYEDIYTKRLAGFVLYPALSKSLPVLFFCCEFYNVDISACSVYLNLWHDKKNNVKGFVFTLLDYVTRSITEKTVSSKFLLDLQVSDQKSLNVYFNILISQSLLHSSDR